MSDVRELNSPGYLASRFGVSVGVILDTFDRLEIQPTTIINGRPHYDECQCGHLHAELINSGAVENVMLRWGVHDEQEAEA